MRNLGKIYQRKDRGGYWLRWSESGCRIVKQFNTKQEAEHFRHLKYMELNRDVYTAIPLSWPELEERYIQWKKICGVDIKEIERFLNIFHRICPIGKSTEINQSVVNYFVEVRQKESGSAYTVKSSVVKLGTLYKWLQENNYAVGKVNFPTIKTGQPQKGSVLTKDQLFACFQRCRDKNERLNFMLSLCSALRKKDVGKIDYIVDDLSDDFANKTGKRLDLPIPPILVKYAAGDELKRLSRNKWERIMGKKKKAKKGTYFTHHDLRRTNAQLVNDAGNIDIASELLQHSSTKVTKAFYLKAGKRAAVNAVFEPMFKEWLK